MPTIPDYKAPVKSDIPEMPPWAEKMLKPINEQMKILTQALQQRLGEKNLNQELTDVRLRSGEETVIAPQSVNGKPRSVELLFTDPQYFHQETVRIISENEVRITAHFSTDKEFSGDPGTVPEDPVLCRIRINGS